MIVLIEHMDSPTVTVSESPVALRNMRRGHEGAKTYWKGGLKVKGGEEGQPRASFVSSADVEIQLVTTSFESISSNYSVIVEQI
jgi:hypothetical protein